MEQPFQSFEVAEQQGRALVGRKASGEAYGKRFGVEQCTSRDDLRSLELSFHPTASGTFPYEAHEFAFHGLAYGPEFLVGDIQDPLPHRRVVAFLRPFRTEILAIELVEFWRDPGRRMDSVGHAAERDLLDREAGPDMLPHRS